LAVDFDHNYNVEKKKIRPGVLSRIWYLGLCDDDNDDDADEDEDKDEDADEDEDATPFPAPDTTTTTLQLQLQSPPAALRQGIARIVHVVDGRCRGDRGGYRSR
jgi:hypothetical protein